MEPGQKIILSIIVPIGSEETAWKFLIADLRCHNLAGVEVILSATGPEPPDFKGEINEQAQNLTLKWIMGTVGRGRQLNHGAAIATGDYLWFLHADTRLGSKLSVSTVIEKLRTNPGSLYFFELHFLKDGPRLMRLNEVGVWIRSHCLRLPFGDQGFALKRELFSRLGGYREDIEHGEDHLLVWTAHRASVRVRPIGLPLFTSARRYERNGWLRTTLHHQWLTGRQAIPELLTTFSKRWHCPRGGTT